MPSTYTTNTGLEKINPGEQDGTWGGTVNTNMDLIDEDTNGLVDVTLTSSHITDGGAYLLNITDGASSEGRNRFINFKDGGDITDNGYVQLTPNTAEKVCIVKNSLSADRTIFIFQGTYSTDNDYEIANGSTVTLRFDGAGTGAVVTDTSTSHTGDVSGTTVLTLGDDKVVTAKIADDAVTTDKIVDDAVTTDKVVDDAVTTAKIVDDAVTTDKVVNDAITYAKMQNVVNDERLLGRTAGPNGVVQELSKSSVLTMLNVADGAVSEVADADDHEDGTWSATVTGTGGGTPVAASAATYIKIAKLVSLFAVWNNINTSGMSGNLQIGGLPFTPDGTAQGAITLNDIVTTPVGAVPITQTDSTMDITLQGSLSAQLVDTGTGKYMRISIIYQLA